MSTTPYFVSLAAVCNLKARAQRRITGVSSAHLSEALAAALGFRTHAALRAALAGRPTTLACEPCNTRLNARLRELGYVVREDLRLLPDLGHTRVLGHRRPLRRRRGARWAAWRNLMVAAVNAGLDQGVFGLSPNQDWWPGATP